MKINIEDINDLAVVGLEPVDDFQILAKNGVSK